MTTAKEYYSKLGNAFEQISTLFGEASLGKISEEDLIESLEELCEKHGFVFKHFLRSINQQ